LFGNGAKFGFTKLDRPPSFFTSVSESMSDLTSSDCSEEPGWTVSSLESFRARRRE
jgi:hypothetical protein